MFNIQDVLKEIGWSSSHHFPISNEENKKYEEELNRLVIVKAKTKSCYEHATSQLEALSKHLKYVEQEGEQNQKLLTAHAQQLDDETHKLKVSRAVHDRILQETKHMNKDIEDLENKQNLKKADLIKITAKLEKLKAETEWDLQAIGAWEESLNKRDIDNELLKKFSKEDDRKSKELENHRQNLQMEVVNRHSLVDKMVAEITNFEQVIERAGKMFKQQAEERASLNRRWLDAVKNLRQRDDDIQRANAEIIMTQEVIVRQEENLNEQNNFLNNEKNNNKLIEIEIGQMNQSSCQQRKEVNDLLHDNITFTNEANNLRRETYAASQHLERERHKHRNLKNELISLRNKMKKIEVEIKDGKVKLKEMTNSSTNSAEIAKHLEDIMNYNNKLTDVLVMDTEKTQLTLFKSQKILNQEKEISTLTEIEISNCQTSLKSLTKLSKETLNRLVVQQEVVYALDFNINEMEVKIAELEGHRKDSETAEAINTKIAQLEHTLSEHMEVKNFLQAQVVHLEEEMRQLGIAISAENDRLVALRGKLQDHLLLCDGGLKHAAIAKLRSQHLQVEENVLKLKVSQLNKSMSKEDKSIYDLQKFKLQLETALRERQIEVVTHKDILFSKKKNLDETYGRLKSDLRHREIRIEQFKKKFHLTLMTLGKDEDGQPLSITYVKVKSAQEKYILQQQLDEIEDKVRKTEKEIIAAENTLKIVNSANAVFRNSLAVIGKDSEEYAQMNLLEREILNENLALRQVKKKLTKKIQHLSELEGNLKELNSRRTDIGQKLIQNQSDYCVLRNEEEARTEKLARVAKQTKKLRKSLTPVVLDKPEKNLNVQFIHDVNKTGLHKFQELQTKYEELSPKIKQYASKNDLKLPESKSKLSISSSSKSSESGLKNRSDSTQSCLSQVIIAFDK